VAATAHRSHGAGQRGGALAAAPGGSTSGAEAARGELPFTGYPLTPLIMLLLLLVLGGLLIRGFLAVRDRLRAGAHG
jgi:hypothetical protein